MAAGRLPSDRRGGEGRRRRVHGIPFASRPVVFCGHRRRQRLGHLSMTCRRPVMQIRGTTAAAASVASHGAHLGHPSGLSLAATTMRVSRMPYADRWWRPCYRACPAIARSSLTLTPKTQRQRSPFSQSCIIALLASNDPRCHLPSTISFLPSSVVSLPELL
jgi:hypothetical protein